MQTGHYLSSPVPAEICCCFLLRLGCREFSGKNCDFIFSLFLVFGFPSIVRFSWKTAESLFDEKVKKCLVVLVKSIAPKNVIRAFVAHVLQKHSAKKCHSVFCCSYT